MEATLKTLLLSLVVSDIGEVVTNERSLTFTEYGLWQVVSFQLLRSVVLWL